MSTLLLVAGVVAVAATGVTSFFWGLHTSQQDSASAGGVGDCAVGNTPPEYLTRQVGVQREAMDTFKASVAATNITYTSYLSDAYTGEAPARVT